MFPINFNSDEGKGEGKGEGLGNNTLGPAAGDLFFGSLQGTYVLLLGPLLRSFFLERRNPERRKGGWCGERGNLGVLGNMSRCPPAPSLRVTCVENSRGVAGNTCFFFKKECF